MSDTPGDKRRTDEYRSLARAIIGMARDLKLRRLNNIGSCELHHKLSQYPLRILANWSAGSLVESAAAEAFSVSPACLAGSCSPTAPDREGDRYPDLSESWSAGGEPSSSSSEICLARSWRAFVFLRCSDLCRFSSPPFIFRSK